MQLKRIKPSRQKHLRRHDAQSSRTLTTYSGQLSFQVSPVIQSAVTIQGISPASGPVGSNVTITGTGFATSTSGNSVAFYGNAPAIIQSGSVLNLTQN